MGLLQIADSLAPLGGYAHSYGLEGMAQQGVLRHGGDVRALLHTTILHSLASADLVLLIHAHRAAREEKPEALVEIDALCSALKAAREPREASLGVGRRLLANAANLAHSARLDRYRALVAEGRCGGHHCVAFGVLAEALGLDEVAAALGYGYTFASGAVSAALRLGLLGQSEAQAILHDAWPALTRAARQAATRTLDDCSAFMPALEIAQMRHERASSRLFSS